MNRKEKKSSGLGNFITSVATVGLLAFGAYSVYKTVEKDK